MENSNNSTSGNINKIYKPLTPKEKGFLKLHELLECMKTKTTPEDTKKFMELREMLMTMKTNQFPVVPTYFENGYMTSDTFLEKGWYAVKINDKGLEIMDGTEINFLEDFDKCIKVCKLHNKTYCGMSKGEIALLFVQRRF